MKSSLSSPRSKVKSLARPKAAKLLAWYDRNRRLLPWRALPHMTANPYHVWLSEIMLQQTTVAAVAPYFQKFIKRWPTVWDLAAAPLDHIMQMWAGLGYYRRAQSLHKCALQICERHDGAFPVAEAELLNLPGFGPYTAAAVTSIAFGKRANVVDGNVERVMARVYAVREPLMKVKTQLRALAAELLPNARYGDYAQALMDLGATICTPRNPKCGICPWNASCQAHALGFENEIPVKADKKARPIRYALAFVAVDKKSNILLRQRGREGLLGGMMEVPSTAWVEGEAPNFKRSLKQAPVPGDWSPVPGAVKHVFTHFDLQINVAVATVPVARSLKAGAWTPLSVLDSQALPSVMMKIIRHALPPTSALWQKKR